MECRDAWSPHKPYTDSEGQEHEGVTEHFGWWWVQDTEPGEGQGWMKKAKSRRRKAKGGEVGMIWGGCEGSAWMCIPPEGAEVLGRWCKWESKGRGRSQLAKTQYGGRLVEKGYREGPHQMTRWIKEILRETMPMESHQVVYWRQKDELSAEEAEVLMVPNEALGLKMAGNSVVPEEVKDGELTWPCWRLWVCKDGVVRVRVSHQVWKLMREKGYTKPKDSMEGKAEKAKKDQKGKGKTKGKPDATKIAGRRGSSVKGFKK